MSVIQNKKEQSGFASDFFGVYMLYCLNPKYKAKIYIGFTTNPRRRLTQHNKGKWSGGAKKTSCKGPWEMVVLVHGFPNKISALAFEWAWQHPDKSRRMKNFEPRRNREQQFKFYCRALQELLSVGPWNKLPLEMSWLNENYMQAVKNVPLHMPWEVNTDTFTSSHIKNNYRKFDDTVKAEDEFEKFVIDGFNCFFCSKNVTIEQRVLCVNEKCNLKSHVICLAEHFTKCNSVLPVDGDCPVCKEKMLWGNIIRKREILLKKCW